MLEHCLALFERVGDEARLAKALVALAFLRHEQGDVLEAIALARRALSIRNTLLDAAERAISHSNLTGYLMRDGKLPEATAHELAALLYFLAIGRDQHLQTSENNHVALLRRARRAGQEHTLPRVADLLAHPEFAPLRDWLTAGQVDLDQLQQAVDAFVAQCREATDRAEPRGPATPPT